jgi:UDP-glucose 4-epimerase
MRVLITGVSGHIGSNIAKHLYNKGYEVIGLSRSACTSEYISQHIQANINSPTFISEIISQTKPCSVIIHCAANLNKNDIDTDISLTNCFGTHQLLKLAAEWQCINFLYISGITVIGKPSYHPVTEQHPVNPQTVYLSSKYYGELLTKNLRKNTNHIILRLSAPIGTGMNQKRILPVFIKQALMNKPITLTGKGSRKQNYVDIRDVNQAVEKSLKNNTNGLFNIAGKKTVANYELAEECIKQINSNSKIRFSGTADPEEGIVWDISVKKAAKLFNYYPKYDIKQSIQTIITGNK